MPIHFTKRHYQKKIILQAVRWYLAYSLSYRNLEEMMQERGVEVEGLSHVVLWVSYDYPSLDYSLCVAIGKGFSKKEEDNRRPVEDG